MYILQNDASEKTHIPSDLPQYKLISYYEEKKYNY